jgi:hypothetical protein
MEKETDEPQKVIRKNALLHGLYAKDVLLPWDSREDFLRLHQDLTDEFFPVGRAEEEAVLDLVFLHWDKRTVRRLWQAEVLSDKFADDIVQTQASSWSEMRKRLRAGARGERTLLGTLEETVTNGLAEVQRLGMKIATDSGPQDKDLAVRMDALSKTLTENLLPLLNALRQAPDAEQAFEKSHSPDRLEKIMRLEAMIDARIAKGLSRLVGIKEFKRTPAGARPANYGSRRKDSD